VRASEPPSELSIGKARYALDAMLAAVRASSATETELARSPWVARAADLAVIPEPARQRPGAAPVYRGVPGGELAVPTGRVFVRFDGGSRAAERESELRAAGYRVHTSPSWAPHTAWLTAASGGVTDALAALPALRRIPGLSHAEPELLRPRGRREQA
jgi:hypothetical protein